jgi:hypothetical protein
MAILTVIGVAGIGITAMEMCERLGEKLKKSPKKSKKIAGMIMESLSALIFWVYLVNLLPIFFQIMKGVVV